MTDPIDYSRPVGWWCPVCLKSYGPHGTPGLCAMRGALCCCNDPSVDKRDLFLWVECIPVYLPIPEGQRPLVEDEVESAEVVTFTIPGTADPAWCAPPGWTTFHDTAEEIYRIVVGINLWAKGATE